MAEGSIGGRSGRSYHPNLSGDYITRPDISPDGWTTDVGIPLSELKPFTKIQGGSYHHMEVQVFEHAIVEVDLDADCTGASTIERLDTGLAYLETLGAPAPVVGAVPQSGE